MITSPTERHLFSVLESSSINDLNYSFPSVENLKLLDQSGSAAMNSRAKGMLKSPSLASPLRILDCMSKSTNNKSIQSLNPDYSINESVSSIGLSHNSPASEMSSIRKNKVLAAQEKAKYESSQRKLFDKHMKYILTKSQHSLDSFREESLPSPREPEMSSLPRLHSISTFNAKPLRHRQSKQQSQLQKDQQAGFTLSMASLPSLQKVNDQLTEVKPALPKQEHRPSILQLPSPRMFTEENHSTIDTPIKSEQRDSIINRKLHSHYMLIDIVSQNNSLATNHLDKYRFFKSVPIGGLIAVTRKSNTNTSVVSLTGDDITHSSNSNNNKNNNKSNNGKRISSNYASILKKQIKLSNEQREISEKKLCVMSKRMSSFFQDETKEHLDIWERYLTSCRAMCRLLEVLFTLEKNNHKNLTYLKRLLYSKTYILEEIIDDQFSKVNFSVITNLENFLISENILSTYFRPEHDLFYILTEVYLKDLPYLNEQLQVYLNAQQLAAAGKIADIIQAEFKMVRLKEKHLIFDQIDTTGQIANLHLKKSYNFFDDYLYNIKPHRNTYKEIQQFEKNFGSISYVNHIDRDMFQNLDKSYNTIRAKNQKF